MEKADPIRRALLEWYRLFHRRLPWRKTQDPYAIWVSEVMLQQTQVKSVLSYYRRFLDRFPDVKRLAAADLDDVLRVWEGMGYYARARNLHRAAKAVCDAHEGIIPREYVSFRRLPGVGDYIAAAVLSIAFDLPLPVVDGNVKRVLSRFFEIDRAANAPGAHRIFREAAAELLDKNCPGIFNQAAMELGATVCKPGTPDCGVCPVPRFCRAFRNGKTAEYPVRAPAKPVPVRLFAAGVIRREETFLILKRPPRGLLGGMWEFPTGEVKPGEPPEAACRREIFERTGLRVEAERFLIRVHHAYTHFKLLLDVYVYQSHSGEANLDRYADVMWVKGEELDRFPVHRAHRKVIDVLRAGGG